MSLPSTTESGPQRIVRVVRLAVDPKALRADQAALLDRHAGASRQAWNWATARWHDWQRAINAHVWALATAEVGLHPEMTTAEFGDAITKARALVRGLGEHKTWQNAAYADARRIHGETALFEDGYTLMGLYRLSAEDPDDRLHWWVAEGRDAKVNGVPRHGVSTYAYQTTLGDFAKAMKAYRASPRYSKKTGRRLGAPRFKRRGEDDGFALMNLAQKGVDPWRIIDGGHRVVLPNVGSLRVQENTRLLRRLLQHGGRPTSARLTRRGERWYASIVVTFEEGNAYVTPPPRPDRRQRAGGVVGIDLGVARLATLSTGEHFPNPRHLDAATSRILVLKRRLDRQHRAGSPVCFEASGRHRKGRCVWGRADGVAYSRQALATRRQITRLYGRVSRQRAGFLHRLTARLVAEHDHVAIEDLNVAGMIGRAAPKPDPDRPGAFLRNRRRAKAGLNRAILDVGFGAFRRQITYKAERAGITLTVVPAPGTSQTCHACGHRSSKNRETQATFRCIACGHVANADINAARNIRDLAGAPPTEKRQHPAGAGGTEKRHRSAPPPSSVEQGPEGPIEGREAPPTPDQERLAA